MTEPNGLLHMQARFYSPVFRRFLSEDPAGFAGGINLYAYAMGDPINMIDPFGLGAINAVGNFFGGVFSTGLDLIGKAWTLPNTMIGLTVGIVSLPFGGKINLGYNAIVFSNLPFGNGALTLGNTILTITSFNELDTSLPTYYARELSDNHGMISGIDIAAIHRG